MGSTAGPHRRYNPLTGEYVLVSPQRATRPWQGQQEPITAEALPSYLPDCYLCPGNARSGGQTNPAYSSTFVFPNDFPALLEEAGRLPPASGLLQPQAVRGVNRVICYSPRHDLTLAQMSLAEIAAVVAVWQAQTAELGQKYTWVQVFQNQGQMMGASNPHPHGQVWALDYLPNEAHREAERQQAYLDAHGRVLLLDYLEQEQAAGERIVIDSHHWVVLVPYWAIWPFETLLLPKRHVPRLDELSAEESANLAGVLRQLMIRYDNLFETPFPYSMGWHGVPQGASYATSWHLHAHFYPPLLRSASVRKFMVGFEMLAEAQRDLTPEQAAERLQNLPDQHYSEWTR